MELKPSPQHFNHRTHVYPQHHLQSSRKPLDLIFEERNGVQYNNNYRSDTMQPLDQPCDSSSTRRTRRTRTTYSPSQIAELEHNFLQASYLTPARLAEVSAKLGLATTQVKIWFKNRRRRKKLSMERDRIKDDSNPPSLSPSNLADHTDGYAGPSTPSDGFVEKSGHFFAPPSVSADSNSFRSSYDPYYYNENNTNDSRGSHYITAAWSTQYQGDHRHQQYDYQPRVPPPPPPPLTTGTCIKTPTANFNIDKAYDPCGAVAPPTWDLPTAVTSIQPEIYPSSGMSTGSVHTANDFPDSSHSRDQQVVNSCNNISVVDIGFKKDVTTNPCGTAQVMDGCTRSFHTYNKIPNELDENKVYRTMDTIMRAYNHQNTSTQFAYCFS